MGHNVKKIKKYTTEQVADLIKSGENKHIGVKLYAILQLTRGYSSRKLEELFLTTHKQICNWADRFDSEGIEGLRIKQGRGCHSRLVEEQKKHLTKVLSESPENYGFNTGNWSGPLLRAYIKKTYNVNYKNAAIYNLMHELGFSFQRAKGFYPERDEVKRQEAKTDIKKL
jgi:transposase